MLRRRIVSAIAALALAFTATAVAAEPARADPNYPCWWSVGGPNNQYQIFQNCLPGRAKIQIKTYDYEYPVTWCTPYGQAWAVAPIDLVEWKTILGFYSGTSCT